MHPTSPVATIDTIAGYLYRRRRSAIPLTAGEAATVAIAVVRGCAAAPSRAAEGQWRLTAEGRPVLIADPEGDNVLSDTVAVLDDIAALVSADVRPGFTRLRDGVLTEPPPTWTTLENRLLAVVQPQPLVLGPLTPVESAPDRPSCKETSDATSRTPLERLRSALGQVRPRVLFAGTGAAVVLVVAVSLLLAPAPAPSSDAESLTTRGAGDTATSPASGVPLPTARPTAVPTEGPVTARSENGARSSEDGEDENPEAANLPETSEDDVRSAAAALLRSFAACADETCTSVLRESTESAGEPRPLDPATAQLEVVDDFGGLAVVRLSTDGRVQYVTLVRPKDRWLVRSVRDVADQPS